MKNSFLLMTIIFLVVHFKCEAQYNGNKFSISTTGIYTTTANLYLNPDSPDPVVRNTAVELNHIFDAGIDVRYRLNDDIILGISTEYMTKSTTDDRITAFSNNRTVAFPVNDGFRFIPLELTVYYLLPFSTDHFKFLMGGGIAYYYGSLIRKIADVEADTKKREFAYGIHVDASMEYLIFSNLSIRTEMKFRDPQFKMTNVYPKRITQYNGNTITFSQNDFTTKVNINGITFILAAVYHFNL